MLMKNIRLIWIILNITEVAMVTIKVVCGIIEHNGKIFICRRKEGKSLAGHWEFPGGKIEPNETPEEALKINMEWMIKEAQTCL